MVNKYLALKGEKFDITKVTIVGSPTITSDGVASGFGKDNYITIQQINFGSATWKYEMTFETGSNVSSEQWVVNSINVGTRNITVVNELVNGVPKIRVRCYVYNTSTSSYNSIQGTFNSFPNTKFNVSIEFDGINSYTFKCNDETQKITNSYKTSGINQILLGKRYPTDTAYFANSDLKINLPSFKIYVDNQLVFQPVKPAYLLERRKPKVWNKGQFTIVGNPSISDSGLLSVNGSNSRYNYCKFDVNLFSTSVPFKIEIPIKVTKLPNADALYFYVGSAIEVVITSSGELKARLRSGTSDTYWDIALNQLVIPAIVQLNQENLLGVIEYTGSEYRLGYKLNNVFTLVTTIQKNIKILEANFGHIGWNSSLEPEYTAFADLKQFKIYADNTLVFDGGAETYVYDPSKFTVVGLPTITEYGVASGFSSENYVTTKNSIDFSNANSWEILTPVFKHSTDLTVLSTVLCGGVTGNQDGIAIFMRPNGKTSWSVQDVQGGSFIFKRDADTTFTDGALNQFKMEFTGNAYNFYHSVNGGAFALVDTFASTTKTMVNTLLYLGVGIGQYYRGDYYALPSTSITVDGKEIFTGAKEQFYMCKK